MFSRLLSITDISPMFTTHTIQNNVEEKIRRNYAMAASVYGETSMEYG